MTNYYQSNDYKNEIFSKVGFNDLAVELNARFALDIYKECEKEYQKSYNIMAFEPITHLHRHFIDMIEKSIYKYHEIKVNRID